MLPSWSTRWRYRTVCAWPALIGATAIELQATLVTANVKHFSAVEGLSFEAFLP